MSHLITNEVIITDLDILRKAVSGIKGLKWAEGKKEFKAYYRNKEQEKELGGKVEHVIEIDKNLTSYSYEVGVVRRKDGTGWSLVFDPFDSYAARHVGRNCENIMSAYNEAYIRDFAEKNGFMMEEATDENGNLVLSMQAE